LGESGVDDTERIDRFIVRARQLGDLLLLKTGARDFSSYGSSFI